MILSHACFVVSFLKLSFCLSMCRLNLHMVVEDCHQVIAIAVTVVVVVVVEFPGDLSIVVRYFATKSLIPRTSTSMSCMYSEFFSYFTLQFWSLDYLLLLHGKT